MPPGGRAHRGTDRPRHVRHRERRFHSTAGHHDRQAGRHGRRSCGRDPARRREAGGSDQGPVHRSHGRGRHDGSLRTPRVHHERPAVRHGAETADRHAARSELHDRPLASAPDPAQSLAHDSGGFSESGHQVLGERQGVGHDHLRRKGPGHGQNPGPHHHEGQPGSVRQRLAHDGLLQHAGQCRRPDPGEQALFGGHGDRHGRGRPACIR